LQVEYVELTCDASNVSWLNVSEACLQNPHRFVMTANWFTTCPLCDWRVSIEHGSKYDPTKPDIAPKRLKLLVVEIEKIDKGQEFNEEGG